MKPTNLDQPANLFAPSASQPGVRREGKRSPMNISVRLPKEIYSVKHYLADIAQIFDWI
jgi:hypothetical protein